MQKTLIDIPAVTYTFHCPLSFSEIIPFDLRDSISPEDYARHVHSINLLLQSCITRSTLETGSIPCCKTTHVMYHGTSDGIRCVNEYLNNNSSNFPKGHSLCLITTELPPILRYEISDSNKLQNISVSTKEIPTSPVEDSPHFDSPATPSTKKEDKQFETTEKTPLLEKK
ncbi:Uncharacterized protein QTN25_005246 [Entamoeba marina]